MNDKLKQSRLLHDQRDENSSLHSKNENNIVDSPENVRILSKENSPFLLH